MNALRKLWDVTVVTLALNFLAMVIAVALVAQRADVSRDSLARVKAVLFPDVAPPEGLPDPPDAEPTPMEQLLELLERQAALPTESRVTDLRETVDGRLALVDRARRELADRHRQVETARRQLDAERTTFEAERDVWETAAAAARDRAADEGFRETLEMYRQLPPRQAKAVLLGLDDDVVLAVLRGMDARAAGRILREFKEDAEVARVRDVLERMRQGRPVDPHPS